MKVIQVFAPMQNEGNYNQQDKQCIDGIYPSWCVRSERSIVNETYIDWLIKKRNYCEIHNCPGIYLYDCIPVIVSGTDVALIIRYDYIKSNN